MGAVLGGNSISLSTIISVIFLILLIVGALKGLSRGFMRQAVRTVTIIASLALSFIVFTGISDKISAYLEGKTVGEVLDTLHITAARDTGYMAVISEFRLDSLSGAMHIIYALILLPMLFTVGFILLSAIGEVVHVFLCAILGFKKSKNNVITRILGMALGALQGVLVAAVLIFPLASVATTVNELDDTGISEAGVLSDYAAEIAESSAVTFTMKFGGNALAKSLATTEIDGEEYDARDALSLFFDVYQDASELKGFTYTEPSNTDKEKINAIEDKLFSDAFVKGTVSGILRELALCVSEGRLAINLEEPYNEMLRAAIAVFENSTNANIEPDMQTILDVYFILADGGVLSAMSVDEDSVRDALVSDNGDGTVISRVIDKLSENERAKAVTTMLARLTISIMSESLDLGVDIERTYDTVVDCLTDISEIDPDLTEEEYTEAVSDIITDTLAREDINIELDESIVDEMAKYVYDEYRGEEITDDEINDILLSYFEAYAKNFN